jgi:hypothetical protein
LVLEAFGTTLSLRDQEDVLEEEFDKLCPKDKEDVLQALKTICYNMETEKPDGGRNVPAESKKPNYDSTKLADAKRDLNYCLAYMIGDDATKADPHLVLDVIVKLSSDDRDDVMEALELTLLDLDTIEEKNRRDLIRKACMNTLVSYMENWLHIPEIQIKGFHLLQMAKHPLAFKSVCAAMKEHPGNCNLQRAGLSALIHTVHVEDARHFVMELNGTAVIVGAMKKFHDDAQIQKLGELMLEKLACI